MKKTYFFILTSFIITSSYAFQVDCSTIKLHSDTTLYTKYENAVKIPQLDVAEIDAVLCYAQKTNNSKLMTAVYRLYGELFYETLDLVNAKEYLTLAVESATENDQIYHKNGALHMLGHTYFQLQNYDYALYLQKQFLESAINNNIEASVNTARIAVGYIYFVIGKYDEAKRYLKIAVENYDFFDYNPFHFNTNLRLAHLYLGKTYHKMGMDEESEYHLSKSIEDFKMIDEETYGYLELFLGNARFYLDLGRMDKFNEIIFRINKMTNFEDVTVAQPRFSCTYFGLMGDFYQKTNDLKQAAYYHDLAFELAKEKELYQNLLTSANFLIEHFTDNPVKDYYLNETQKFLFNMHQNNLDGARFTNLSKSLQLESEKIGMLIKERNMLMEKGAFRNILLVVLCICLLIASLALYFMFRYYRQTLLQKEEIQKVHLSLDAAYEDLRVINDKLIRSNNDLYNFAAVIAHDLKSPLRAINFFTGELYKRMKNEVDEESNENFNFIMSSAEKMTSLIEALLAFSRVTANLPNPNKVALKSILDDTRVFRGLTITKEVTIGCDAFLGEIKGHETLLGQLFYNLISNAIKFTPVDRNPEIYISLEYENQEEICLSVQDNGVGIPQNYLPYIFTIFKTFYFENCNVNEGSGVGLSICKRIVEFYNGKIWATSKETEGTKIYFTLKKDFDKETELEALKVDKPKLQLADVD